MILRKCVAEVWGNEEEGDRAEHSGGPRPCS